MSFENPQGLLRSHTLSDLKEPTLVSFVDMARWLAALTVMVGHLRNPMFIGWGELPAADRTWWVKLWFFATGYHAEAVLVFFVLSGYLVGGLSAARGAQGKWHPGGYAIDRISRLFIAFLPALLLTVVLDYAGAHYFGGTGLYDGTHPMVVQKMHGTILQDRLTWPIFIGNAAMLQYYFVPELGSNDPLWTLSTEFWFYVLFGLMLTAWLARRPAVRWGCAVVALAASALLGSEFVLYLGMWLIGFLASQLPRPPLSHPLIATGAMLAWLAAIRLQDAYLDAHLGYKFVAHYVLAALFGWIILSMRDRRIPWLTRAAPFNKAMADFSYSVYLIHFPVIWFALAFLGTVSGVSGFRTAFRPTDPVGVATYVGLIFSCLAAAWLFARATEAHTATLRQALRARFIR